MASPPSYSQSLLPNPDILVLEGIERDADRFRLLVHVEQKAACPLCGEVSQSCHSSYRRHIQHLPWQASRCNCGRRLAGSAAGTSRAFARSSASGFPSGRALTAVKPYPPARPNDGAVRSLFAFCCRMGVSAHESGRRSGVVQIREAPGRANCGRR